jgi:hypothetical protein
MNTRNRPRSVRVLPNRAILLALSLPLLAAAFPSSVSAQGCVAVKQMTEGFCPFDIPHADMAADVDAPPPAPQRWNLNVSYQYFRSHRHFVSSVEQTHRYDAGSEVINLVSQVDVDLRYDFNSRTSLNIGIPYFHAVRTSLYEHDRVNRHATKASGIGDMRFGAQMWLRAPGSDTRSNVAIGLGIKAPTGNSNVKDTFHTAAGPVVRNVDQSIQPGDGGWGVSLIAQAYQRLTNTTTLYASAFYLVNPLETNGTRTNSSITSSTAYMSVADQYQVRAGVSQVVSSRFGLSASLGGRIEAVQSEDLIGGDRGFRRPGYVMSVEPGISIVSARDAFNLSVPIAFRRSRIKSFIDWQNGRHGDAAFADFAVNFSYSRRW